MSRTASRLGDFAREFARLSAITWLTASLGLAALILGGAAWGARLGWFGQPVWVFAAWGTVLAAVVALGAAGVRRTRDLSAPWLARQLERQGFRPGALAGHLEPAAAGTSAELLGVADLAQDQELAARGPALVAELLAPRRRRVLLVGLGLVAGAALLISARPFRGQPALLWRVGEAWETLRAPLGLRLPATEVERGATLEVEVTARGRRTAILWTRGPGESWSGRGVTLDSTGRALLPIGPLENDLFLRLSSGGRSSDTLMVKVRLPAFLGTLSVVARYPRYLALEDEPLPTDGDTIFVPAGTRIETTGEATTVLASAAWQAGGERAALEVDGARFRGSFTPGGARVWLLALATRSGAALAGDSVRMPVITVPDSAPRVDVPVPGADTLVPLSLSVPLVVDAQDDHGVARVVVESRRISRLGFADPPRIETVVLPEGARDRLLLPYQLDLNARGLLPGDSVRFVVRVSDNAPVPQTTTSREFLLRLPTLSEVREAARATTESVGRRLDSITEASRRLERQTEDLAEQRPRGGEREGGTNESLSYENAQRAEQVSQSQEQLVREAEEVQRALEELQRGAEAAGLDDPAWQERLREIQEQLERALTPELRERLAELQRALDELDPERAREALERLAEAQRELREALERSRELFKRAAIEGDLANLAAEARDLAAQQEQWNEQLATMDSVRAGLEEQALGAKTDSLGAALDRLAEELQADSPERQAALEAGAERARNAARQMRQAGKSAAQGKKQAARQQGQQALEELAPLEQELTEQREQMQEEWREEVVDALDRILADAGRLAERQLQVSDELRQGNTSPQVRSEQGAIEEGVARLLDQVKEAAGKNALVGQQAGTALAAGRDQMRQAREALQTAAPNSREAARRAGEAVDALNAAAFSLLRSRGQVEGSGSGSGLQEAMEQMRQMAQQQGQIGQQAGGMLPMMGQGGQMQEQLRQLGARQRALAERLERMRAGGQIPGANDLAQEAKELARQLEAGRLDRQTVERQERLFRRMLDAGRTLQGQEEDQQRERQSEAATGDSLRLPPALRGRLVNDRLRFPTWEEMQQLSPDERRRVTEYFRRLSDAPAAAARADQPAPSKE